MNKKELKIELYVSFVQILADEDRTKMGQIYRTVASSILKLIEKASTSKDNEEVEELIEELVSELTQQWDIANDIQKNEMKERMGHDLFTTWIKLKK